MATPKSGKTKKIELNEEQVTYMVSIGCTQSEVASFFKCSVDTLTRNYAAALSTGVETGKASAKRTMWRLFNLGNTAAVRYIVHNILKQKFEDPQVKNHIDDEAAKALSEKMESLSDDELVAAVREARSNGLSKPAQ